MKRIQIPGVQLASTQLVMGTGGDAYHPDHMDHVTRLSDAYIELGGNTFDSAHQYEGSEEALGRWLEKRNIRDRVVILTKGCHPDDGNPGPRVSAKYIKEDLMESLDRLRVKHVEMYALHRDDVTVPVGEVIEALNQALRDGYVRTIGASNWKLSRVIEANQYAQDNNLKGFAFTSPNFSLAKPLEPHWPGCVSADESFCQWHESNQIPLLAWSAQAGGFFSGRFSPNNRDNEDMVRVYYSEENWERLNRARALATKKDVTPIQIALAYVLHQRFPTFALIGPEKVEELQSSFTGAEISLSPTELDWLDLKTNDPIFA
ncbi:oxidoreductase [Paenibacillus baekrokdamisoli]|uniref:Oxidoreductase n=1 Tax=Paenibacillus baekrokdamisoli TaxID=1712516 RepID=A0A3G9J7U6_9BACL|nr:aldo/keto reductase [Paenibacillus baekrokdamisoli]MBB3072867.1 aryl-alcohol dehydrogenase-like predicted oxidoreductase [Paenibacillus baekrokdamisoli]BBH24425.1 oxidoreductase [Paenibacillus baekrokdamisoli]